MNRPGDDHRESLRSGAFWGSVLRTMAAVASIRLAVRIGIAAAVALVLAIMAWHGS